MRGAIATEADQIVFLTLLVASMVLVRLSLGWPLVILSAIALVYAYFGYLIPGKYGHGGYDGSRSEEHTSELQSPMRISYAVFCLNKEISIQQTDNIKLNHRDNRQNVSTQ